MGKDELVCEVKMSGGGNETHRVCGGKWRREDLWREDMGGTWRAKDGVETKRSWGRIGGRMTS